MSVSSFSLSSFGRFACLCFVAGAIAWTHPAAALVVPQSTTTPAPTGSNTSPTPGVNENCITAQNAAVEAVAANAKAVIVDTMPQPPSVLQQTCFDQAAQVGATRGGDIFSGDFSGELQPIVGSALASLNVNFEGAISSLFGSQVGGAVSGVLGGLLGGGGSGGQQADYNCEGIGATWEAMTGRGVGAGLAMNIQDLMNGAPPQGASENFLKSWNASKERGVFNNLNSARSALPRPQVKSYNGTDGLCGALSGMGVISGGNCRDLR